MKKAIPYSLRVGYNTPWKTKTNVLNYNKSILIQLTIRHWLFYMLNAMSRKIKSFCFLLDVFSSDFDNFFQFFLKGIFFRFKINRAKRFNFRYFIKQKGFFFRQKTIFFFFRVLQTFFLNKYNTSVLFYWKNYADMFAVNPLLKFLLSFKRRLRKRFKKIRFFFKIYSYLLLFFFYKDPILLGKIFSFLFSRTRRHSRLLRFLRILLSFLWRFFPKLKVLHLCFSGRFNGKDRTLRKWIRFGQKLKLQTFEIEVPYYFTKIVTPMGVLGLQIWLL